MMTVKGRLGKYWLRNSSKQKRNVRKSNNYKVQKRHQVLQLICKYWDLGLQLLIIN